MPDQVNGYIVPRGSDACHLATAFTDFVDQLLAAPVNKVLQPEAGGTGRTNGSVALTDHAGSATTATNLTNVTNRAGAAVGISLDRERSFLDGNGYFHIGGDGVDPFNAQFGGTAPAVGVNGILPVSKGGTGRAGDAFTNANLFYQRTTIFLQNDVEVPPGARAQQLVLNNIVANSVWAAGFRVVMATNLKLLGGDESLYSIDRYYVSWAGDWGNITGQDLHLRLSNFDSRHAYTVSIVDVDLILIPQSGASLVGYEHYTHNY